MKLSLGQKDPSSKKAIVAMRRDWKQLEAAKRRLLDQPSPMPEWAIEDARAEGRRHKAKGFSVPLLNWSQWPVARAAYLEAWQS